MNKKNLIVLPLIALLLTGCKDKVKELYVGNAYASTDFLENYYDTWNEDLKTKVSSQVAYDMPFEGDLKGSQTGKFNVDANQKTAQGITPSLTYVKVEDQMNPDNKELLDWYHDTPVEDKGVGYGPTKNLSTIDKSFAYGYLSKLYDGRIQCDGYYQRSRVQMNDKGYGTSFPKQLENAKYIALAMRGGTTCSRNFSQPVTLTLNFSLYSYDFNTKTYTQHLYQMSHCPVITNSSGHTELVSFYFNEDKGIHLPSNVTAMSLTYSIENSEYDNLTNNVDEYKQNKEDKSLFALMLYEVLIPDSTWR
ncbi:MAG: hypothetical protein MJ248_00865 [Bacilli bacterium]|nr:hypothetical protein [Bacilli bacterium]